MEHKSKHLILMENDGYRVRQKDKKSLEIIKKIRNMSPGKESNDLLSIIKSYKEKGYIFIRDQYFILTLP